MNIEEIVEKWEKTKLLEHCSSKENLAACLESQRLMNERAKNMSAKFKRISIPLTYRVFSYPANNVFTNYFNENTIFNAYMLKTKFNLSENESLNMEVSYVEQLANDLKVELEEMFKDNFQGQIQFDGFSCHSDDNNIVMFWA
ncbi:MAG: hypothetical protein DWQ19_12665 [Crenarchaeota archaeon]|nr:MAG: hypothetical protein DWQ19_12665 [Thermoproteota archaeon]